MKNRSLAIITFLLILLIFMTGCSSGTPAATTPGPTFSQEGATLVQERCTACHPLSRVENARYSAAEWKVVVDMMISRGAQLSPEEETIVVNYLVANYGQ